VEDKKVMQEYNDQQQPMMPVGFSNNSNMMGGVGSSIALMTNPENELYKLELTLKGMSLDREGNPVKIGDPLLNDKGVASVLGISQTIISQVTIMSYLEMDEIKNTLMMFLADTLVKDLMMNRLTYQIRSASARDIILFTVLSSCFICLKRGWEGDDKRFWKGTTQEVTMRHEGGEDKKGGILAKALGWGK
jgi:hypothetical protein